MVESPSSKSYVPLAGKENSEFYMHSEDTFPCSQDHAQDNTLKQLKPVNTLVSFPFDMRFNIILASACRSLKYSFFIVFNQISRTFLLYVMHITCPVHLILFMKCTNYEARPYVISCSCFSVSFRLKYSPQDSDLRRHQYT
jgi:hypothetical protein